MNKHKYMIFFYYFRLKGGDLKFYAQA